MHKSLIRKALVVGIIILMIGVNVSSSFARDADITTMSPVGFDGNTLYVGGSGPNNYTRIQDAIDNASDGDTIFVFSGIYYENLTINKSIKLLGEDKYQTIIDGENVEKDGVSLILIKRNDVLVNGFTLQNSNWSYNTLRFDSGISLINSNNITIINTQILECRRGVELIYSSATITNNMITRTRKYGDTGIGVWNSEAVVSSNIVDGDYSSNIFSVISNTSIEKNIIRNSSTYGIHISDSLYAGGTKVIGNHIQKNSFGIFMDYSYSIKVENNNFIDNRLNVLFSNCLFTKWNGNYWDRPRILPKPILGFIWVYPSIPILNFDWHPAQEPYDIPAV